MVGKTDFKENPKSNLDLDLGFVKIRWCLSPHRFSLQSAEVHKFLKVEAVNLTAKAGGVLKETNLLYNQQRWTNFLQLEDVTLPENLGGVLKHKIHFSINYGQQMFTRKRCNFN